jgi:tetratricopeptide (TPR) repeat protein
VSAAPPESSSAPWQLPAAVSHFTGRTAELDALTAALDRSAAHTMVISALAGMGGVGKTALAVQWAHQVAGRFRDGQLYVNLRGYDAHEPVSPGDALAGFLRALGVAGQQIPDDAEERARLYRSRLAGRRMLVLLDNARDSEQVRPLLPGDPGCAAVVTSRDQLAGLVVADGARRLDLDVLAPADAVGLLRSLIGSRADEDPAAVADLAGLCARLPLALRIAAEHAAARPDAALGGLVTELTTARLDGLDAGDARADVRAVLSWSVRQLPDDVAAAFALIGLHPGTDLDTYAAAALTGTTAARAHRMLGRLHRASLVQAAGPGRYGMHDLLRAYAREQAPARDGGDQRRQALTGLFDYYLAAAAAAMDVVFPAEAHHRPAVALGMASAPEFSGEADARGWLDRERANLVAAAVYCANRGWPEHATSLAATTFRYLLIGNYLPEALTICEHALQAARESGDLAAEAGALNGLGGIRSTTGHFRDASGHFQAALACYRRCGNRDGEARALCNLSEIEYRLNNHHVAADYGRQAIAAFGDAGDRLGMARALCELAGPEIELGSLDQASEHLQLAVQVLRADGDQVGEAEALQRMGALGLRRGELADASRFHEQSLAIFRRIDHPTGIAAELRNLGEVGLRRGDYPHAISCLQQALALFCQIGDQHGETLTRRGLARGLRQAGQASAARAQLETALRLAADTGSTYQQASVHRDLADSHHAVGQDEHARHHWQQALTLYTQLGAPEADKVRSSLTGLRPGVQG